MKINAVELERQIDNGFDNPETLISELFEFIEAIVYSVETSNTNDINALVEQWRSDEVIDPEIDEDLDFEEDDDVEESGFYNGDDD